MARLLAACGFRRDAVDLCVILAIRRAQAAVAGFSKKARPSVLCSNARSAPLVASWRAGGDPVVGNVELSRYQGDLLPDDGLLCRSAGESSKVEYETNCPGLPLMALYKALEWLTVSANW